MYSIQSVLTFYSCSCTVYMYGYHNMFAIRKSKRQDCIMQFSYYIMIMKNGFRTFLSAKTERETSAHTHTASVIGDVSNVEWGVVVFR